ncbi:MAG: prepilin-type N-terminal cleavage/methylation domain-containing protein [Parcubacteria group bacterium]|nr:prepilin-type N-terminal cleavage/methylation domain-containing protein [Parcubacteria group bacterium]
MTKFSPPSFKAKNGFTHAQNIVLNCFLNIKLCWDFIFSRKTKKSFVHGFTLIELVVTLGIITVVLSIVIINFSKSGEGIILTDVAYQTAISIRQAQVYGLSVKQSGTTPGFEFDAGYGAHFDIDDPTSFILFADKNKNSVYDAGSGDCPGTIPGNECIEKIVLQTGYTVESFGKIKNDAIFSLFFPSSVIEKLDITFKRPNPDAVIVSDSTALAPDEIGAVIRLQSVGGKEKDVTVFSTGQISVEDVAVTAP